MTTKKQSLRKKYRSAKGDREAAEYRDYLYLIREIENLVREISQDIVDEGIVDLSQEIADDIDLEADINEQVSTSLTTINTPTAPRFIYVDNAKPSLGRYKGVGTLPAGCQSCGARHRPL